MKNLLEQLSKILGYEVPECQSPQLYYQLMALQVGTLSNPESKEQLRSIDIIVILAEICKIILKDTIKVQESFNIDGTKSSRKVMGEENEN